MARTLWEYLTKPVDGGYKPGASYADVTLHNATIVPRLIARTGKSVYDSFKRGITPLQLGEDPYLRRIQDTEDAFNVAGAAMVGGMPGVPKGNSPSTLGMAFRRPQDVVAKPSRNIVPYLEASDTSTFANIMRAYSNYVKKDWGTNNDQLVKYIDNGGVAAKGNDGFITDLSTYPVPAQPAQESSVYDLLRSIREGTVSSWDKEHIDQAAYMAKQVRGDLGTQQIARTPAGKYFEDMNDLNATHDNASVVGDELHWTDGINRKKLRLNELAVENNLADRLSQKQVDYYINNKDSNLFLPPRIGTLELEQLLPHNSNRMSLTDMLRHGDNAWNKEQAKSLKMQEKLHEFDDGHYWTQLKTQAQREAESEAMGNSTRMSIHDGKDLYSLRDKNGKSILTASFIPEWNTFDEVKTRFNNRDVLGEITKSSTPSDHEFYKYVMALKDKAKSNGQNK